MISWYDQLIDPVYVKKPDMDDYNLLELISVIIHCFYYYRNQTSLWKQYWEFFEETLENKNRDGWPELTFMHDPSTNRLETHILSGDLNIREESNFLMLLLQLIFIEKAKNDYKHKNNFNTKSYLKCVIRKNIFRVSDGSLGYLVNLLKLHLEKYQAFYHGTNIEIELSTRILNIIPNISSTKK